MPFFYKHSQNTASKSKKMTQFRIIRGMPIEYNKLLQINTLQQFVLVCVILFLKVVPSAAFFRCFLSYSYKVPILLCNRLTVSTWGEAGGLLEHSREMMRIIKAEQICCLIDVVTAHQQVLRQLDDIQLYVTLG